MVLQESNIEETTTLVYSEDMQETTFEEEETLSLSDLPLYGHTEWEEEAALSSPDHDYEFNFSQELSPSPTTAALSPPENVVFCGKLIPYKQPSHHHGSDKGESTKKRVGDVGRNRRGGGLTRRIQSKNGNRLHGSEDIRLCNMSILTSSSSGKARWYLFFFGIRSFSTKMELRDIRSRQNRRQCPSQPPSPLLPSSSDRVVSQRRNRGCGFWEVIRALSCGGNHHTETSVSPFIDCTLPEGKE